MAMNTDYLNTTAVLNRTSGVSELANSVSSFAAVVVTGATTLTGAATLGAALNSASAISGGALTATTGVFAGSNVSLVGYLKMKSFTSTSVDSTTMSDGQISGMSVSVGSAMLAFRSGNTTYQFIADAAVGT